MNQPYQHLELFWGMEMSNTCAWCVLIPSQGYTCHLNCFRLWEKVYPQETQGVLEEGDRMAPDVHSRYRLRQSFRSAAGYQPLIALQPRLKHFSQNLKENIPLLAQMKWSGTDWGWNSVREFQYNLCPIISTGPRTTNRQPSSPWGKNSPKYPDHPTPVHGYSCRCNYLILVIRIFFLFLKRQKKKKKKRNISK